MNIVNKNKETKQDCNESFENIIPSKLFDQKTYLFLFVSVFSISYFVFKMRSGGIKRGGSIGISPSTFIIDIIVFGLMITGILLFYAQNKNEMGTSKFWEDTFYSWIDYLDEDYGFITNVLSLLALYLVIYLFGIPMSYMSKPASINIIEGILIVLITVSGFLMFFKYVLDIDIVDLIKGVKEDPKKAAKTVDASGNVLKTDASGNVLKTDASGNVLKTDASGNLLKTDASGNVLKTDASGNEIKKEVFNVSNNKYTYEEAQAVCSVFDAELATYDQVEKAYQNGGEWCNYGWSQGQMALFPTQKSTWKKLQDFPKHKNDCGRPGINGGYFKNPYIKFGVNCFGVKPEPTEEDKARLKTKNIAPYPLSPAEKELEEKVNKWKKNKKELALNSYNNTVWSKY